MVSLFKRTRGKQSSTVKILFLFLFSLAFCCDNLGTHWRVCCENRESASFFFFFSSLSMGVSIQCTLSIIFRGNGMESPIFSGAGISHKLPRLTPSQVSLIRPDTVIIPLLSLSFSHFSCPSFRLHTVKCGWGCWDQSSCNESALDESPSAAETVVQSVSRRCNWINVLMPVAGIMHGCNHPRCNH